MDKNGLIEINKLLVEQYSKNLEFFKENFNDLFIQINELSNKIDSGEYKEKYVLEIKEEGYFDILCVESNEFFYDCNSYSEAQLREKMTDMRNDSFTFDLLYKNKDNNEFDTKNINDELKPMISLINRELKLKSNSVEFERIGKMVYIGTGLGIHLPLINAKLKPSTVLIVEPNIEIFRLSMFLSDYSQIAGSVEKLFLNVGTKEQDRKNNIFEFFEYGFNDNYIFKYHIIKATYSSVSDDVYRLLMSINPLLFTYEGLLKGFERTVEYMDEGYKFIKNKKQMDILASKEVLILSAGPSLGKNIQWIKDNRDSFFIIAINVILPLLEKNNINPDLIISADLNSVVEESFKSEEFIKDIPTLLVSHVDSNVLSHLNKESVYMIQSLNLIDSLDTAMSVGNVGTHAMCTAIKLGAKKVYTLGNDAALNQETGDFYSSDTTPLEKNVDINVDDENIRKVSEKDIFELKGNFGDQKKTTRHLLNIKDNYEKAYIDMIKSYRFEVFNLSDGLYMKGLKPLRTKDVVFNLSNTGFNLKKELDKNSHSFKSSPLKEQSERFDHILSLIKYFEDFSFNDKTQFLENKIKVIIQILTLSREMDSHVYKQIYTGYFKLIDIYLNYALQTKNADDFTVETLDKLKHYWCSGIKDLTKRLKQRSS